jgi:hypothetical protein
MGRSLRQLASHCSAVLYLWTPLTLHGNDNRKGRALDDPDVHGGISGVVRIVYCVRGVCCDDPVCLGLPWRRIRGEREETSGNFLPVG